MTDVSQLSGSGDAHDERGGEIDRSLLGDLAPYACVVLGAALGLALGRALGADKVGDESSLALLLRFMAAMKFAAVLGAAAAVQWRKRRPIDPKWSRAYLAALLLMAPAPGLIFSLGAVAVGAVLFHVGLFVFLVLAWQDDRLRLPTRR